MAISVADKNTRPRLDADAHVEGVLAGDRTVLFLAEGTCIVEIVPVELERRATRIDGRNESLYLAEPGLYRIETTAAGGLRLEVWQGLAEVSTDSGGVLVRSDEAARMELGAWALSSSGLNSLALFISSA